ncbi:ash family protein [Aggregatibacter kilianii]|uniref:ash family protein n=1 Tax=Aggregatibacter kilianii TaxID=2025884 RepID=UPI001EF61C84|nr:ash family protein [Aggregatibacter kilianii]
MPLNHAFFVRNIRTLQNKLRILFQHLSTIYSSMVARNRQPFAVGCFPITTVFHPVTFYRPTVESIAVVSKISYWNLRNETIHFCGYSPYRFI